MMMRKQDWFKVAVCIAFTAAIGYNEPEFIDYFVNGGEEPMYYYAVIGLHLACIGFIAGTVWEILKYNEKI